MKNRMSLIIVFINRAVDGFDAVNDWKDTGEEHNSSDDHVQYKCT